MEEDGNGKLKDSIKRFDPIHDVNDNDPIAYQYIVFLYSISRHPSCLVNIDRSYSQEQSNNILVFVLWYISEDQIVGS